MSDKNKSIEYFWKLKGFKPNCEQKNAILHTDGPLFITAGPGSGKTRLILWRTFNLIVFHNVKPDEIFLSTFTKKAAHQLKEGLRSLLGMATNETGIPYDISRMSLGTIHSICQNLISDRRFSHDARRNKVPAIIDELAQYFLLYRIRNWEPMIQAVGFETEEEANNQINQYFDGRVSRSRHYAVLSIIKIFNRFSEECIDPKNYEEGSFLGTLLNMYDFYKTNLLQKNSTIGSVDLSLLQQEAYNLISSFEGGQKVFKHIIIDEYQDTNSIQEKIFFELAKGFNNICIVGDDDQALYRFRGATVENLVEFEARCQAYLGVSPNRVDLKTNYRSKKSIVNFYTDFIRRIDWQTDNGNGYYRVHDKEIESHNQDDTPLVYSSSRARPDDVYSSIASLVQELLDKKIVDDENQVAFLFPYLKGSTRVNGFKEALEDLGLRVYAPRAGRFLEVDEARAVFGVFFHIFGRPSFQGHGSRGLTEFRNWIRGCIDFAEDLIEADDLLESYIDDRIEELDQVKSDYEILLKVCERNKIGLKDPFDPNWIRKLLTAGGLSDKAKKALSNKYLLDLIKKRKESGRPYLVSYILNRATSVDWSILDIFYQLCAFQYFRNMFDLAESGSDEGPICNLGLLTHYISRYMDDVTPVITASFIKDDGFIRSFFSSYTYAIFRLNESEYEDDEVPFPRGRIPFLTIHQAKGLEFPIVILASVYKREGGTNIIEESIRYLTNKVGEPLDRISRFDNMRMFYVALSRGENLVVLPNFSGQG